MNKQIETTVMPTPVIDWNEIHRLHNERCEQRMAEFKAERDGLTWTDCPTT